jgi:hypothetical protein
MGGPRDRIYSGYLVQENPWLQLQGHCGPTRCPLCPDSDQIPQRRAMSALRNRRHPNPTAPPVADVLPQAISLSSSGGG